MLASSGGAFISDHTFREDDAIQLPGNIFMNDPSHVENKPEIHELQELQGGAVRVIDEAAAKWKELANGLYFKSHDIANIEHDVHPFTVSAACRDVLIEWNAGKGRKPVNWRTLLEALNHAGQNHLADKLRTVLLDTKE